MRKKIYEIIEAAEDDNQLSRLYDVIMLFFILLSIIPLTFKETNRLLYAIDKITVSVFIEIARNLHLSIDTLMHEELSRITDFESISSLDTAKYGAREILDYITN